MDNLIRAKNYLPIVQFDSSHITAVVTSKLSGTINGGQTLMNTGSKVTTTPVISAGSIVHGAIQLAATGTQMAVRPFTFAITPERDNALNVQLDPVTNHNEIYVAYDYFAHSLGSGDAVRDSIHNPPPPKNPNDPDAVHVGRQWHGVFYWVPRRYARDFFNLSLVTTVARRAGQGANGTVVPGSTVVPGAGSLNVPPAPGAAPSAPGGSSSTPGNPLWVPPVSPNENVSPETRSLQQLNSTLIQQGLKPSP